MFPVFLSLHHAAVIVQPDCASAEGRLAKHLNLDNIKPVSADFCLTGSGFTLGCAGCVSSVLATIRPAYVPRSV